MLCESGRGVVVEKSLPTSCWHELNHCYWLTDDHSSLVSQGTGRRCRGQTVVILDGSLNTDFVGLSTCIERQSRHHAILPENGEEGKGKGWEGKRRDGKKGKQKGREGEGRSYHYYMFKDASHFDLCILY